MHNQVIIGLHGLKESGKSTTAKVLARAFSLRRISFAERLKKMLNVMLEDITDDRGQAYDFFTMNEAQKNTPIVFFDGKTPRQLMQTLGTEWGRNMICKDVWTRIFDSQMRARNKPPYDLMRGWVIDDVRHAEEAIKIRELGGVIVEITRDGIFRKSNHSSEDRLSDGLIDFSFHLPKNDAEIITFFAEVYIKNV